MSFLEPMRWPTLPKDDGVSAVRVPALTSQGHLVLATASVKDAHALPGGLQARIEAAFACGVGHALRDLGVREVGTALPPDFAYWRDFAGKLVGVTG